jgi:hypothetical protein
LALKKKEKKLVEKMMGKIAGCEFCRGTGGLRFMPEGMMHS